MNSLIKDLTITMINSKINNGNRSLKNNYKVMINHRNQYRVIRRKEKVQGLKVQLSRLIK